MLETLEVLRPVLKIEENTATHGIISLEPLDRGYGMTIGNALRRVLLSSISGAAITAVHIDGVLHEFSTVPGVREDVIQVLMYVAHFDIVYLTKKSIYLIMAIIGIINWMKLNKERNKENI